MKVTLTPDVVDILDRLVAKGYGTYEAVIHTAVLGLALDDADAESEPDPETLKALVQEALEEDGPYFTVEEVQVHLEAKHAARVSAGFPR